MNDDPIHEREAPTSSIEESTFDAAVFDAAVEHCFEKLDMLVTRLHRYPLDAVCVAMGMYLQDLLGLMLDERQFTADEIRDFLREFESGVLEAQGPAEK